MLFARLYNMALAAWGTNASEQRNALKHRSDGALAADRKPSWGLAARFPAAAVDLIEFTVVAPNYIVVTNIVENIG